MARLTRRLFLGRGAGAAGGLAIGGWYATRPRANPLHSALDEGDAVFNPYVLIREGGEIVIVAPRAEMGQGVSTTLAAMAAEELEVGLDQVRVEHGPPSPAYANTASTAALLVPAWETGGWASVMRGLGGNRRGSWRDPGGTTGCWYIGTGG